MSQAPRRPACLRPFQTWKKDEAATWSDDEAKAMNEAFVAAVRAAHPER